MCLVRPNNACLGAAGWGFLSAGKSEMPRVVDKRQSHAGALLASRVRLQLHSCTRP